MNLRRTAYVVLILFLLGLAWLVYQNRGSQTVMTAALAPLVLLGGYHLARRLRPESESFVTAALAAIVAVILVLALTPRLEFKQVFGTMYILNARDGTPAEPLIGFLPSRHRGVWAINAAPSEIWSTDLAEMSRVYHHLLQRAILESLIWSGRWGSEVVRIDAAPCGGYNEQVLGLAKDSGNMVGVEDVRRAFAENHFIAAPFHPMETIPFPLPPGAAISGKVPDQRSALIKLSNRYFSLVIETEMAGFGTILRVPYALWTRTDGEDDPRFSWVRYHVSVSGRGSWLFSHHPDMSTYEGWVRRIASALGLIFDEYQVWRAAVECMKLRHILAPQGSPSRR